MDDRRKHISSGLAAESLVAKRVTRATEGQARPVLPDLWLVLIGGSLFDRGGEAILPLAERLVELRATHQLAVCCGGGVRQRHTYKIGLDLGLPVGGLAAVAGAIEEQNALMLWALTAHRGAIRLNKEELELLPLALAVGQLPILVAQPPYHYWEYPRAGSGVPLHGDDCGTVLLTENFGCRCVLLKDVDGIYEADPADHPGARRLTHVRVDELLAGSPRTLPVEQGLLDIMRHTRHVTRVCVTSGLDPDNLDRILAGEKVGTVLEGSHARP
jgi:molybdenum storage protein